MIQDTLQMYKLRLDTANYGAAQIILLWQVQESQRGTVESAKEGIKAYQGQGL